MLTNVTSLTGNGLKDWLIQRITAVVLLFYTLFLAGFILLNANLDYTRWYALFHTPWFSVATILAVLSLSLHAWIGLWTVTTDYIKLTSLRIVVQTLIASWLIAQLIWVFMIIWGQK